MHRYMAFLLLLFRGGTIHDDVAALPIAAGKAIGVLLEQQFLLSAKDIISLERVNTEFSQWIQYQPYWNAITVLRDDARCFTSGFAENVFVAHDDKASGKPTLQVNISINSKNFNGETEAWCFEKLLGTDAQVEILPGASVTAARAQLAQSRPLIHGDNVAMDHYFRYKLRVTKSLLMTLGIQHNLSKTCDYLLKRNQESFLHAGHLIRSILHGNFDVLGKLIPLIPDAFMWIPTSSHYISCFLLSQAVLRHELPHDIVDMLRERGRVCTQVFLTAAAEGRTSTLEYLLLKEQEDNILTPDEFNKILLKGLKLVLRGQHRNTLVMLLDEFKPTITSQYEPVLIDEVLTSVDFRIFQEFFVRVKSQIDFNPYIKEALVTSSLDIVEYLLTQLRGNATRVHIQEALYAFQNSRSYSRLIWILDRTANWSYHELGNFAMAVKLSASFHGEEQKKILQHIQQRRVSKLLSLLAI